MKKIILIICILAGIAGAVYFNVSGVNVEPEDVETEIGYADGRWTMSNVVEYEDDGYGYLNSDLEDVEYEYSAENNDYKPLEGMKTTDNRRKIKVGEHTFLFLGHRINCDYVKSMKYTQEAIEFSNGTDSVTVSYYSETPIFFIDNVKGVNQPISKDSEGHFALLAENVTFLVQAESEEVLQDLFTDTKTSSYVFSGEVNSEYKDVVIEKEEIILKDEENIIFFDLTDTEVGKETRNYFSFAAPTLVDEPYDSLPWMPLTNVNYGPVALSQSEDNIEPITAGPDYNGYIVESDYLDAANGELIIPSVNLVVPVWNASTDQNPYIFGYTINTVYIGDEEIKYTIIRGHSSPKSTCETYGYSGMSNQYKVETGDYAYLFMADGSTVIYEAAYIEPGVIVNYGTAPYDWIGTEISEKMKSQHSAYLYTTGMTEAEKVDELMQDGTYDVLVTHGCNHEEYWPEEIRNIMEYRVYWVQIDRKISDTEQSERVCIGEGCSAGSRKLSSE